MFCFNNHHHYLDLLLLRLREADLRAPDFFAADFLDAVFFAGDFFAAFFAVFLVAVFFLAVFLVAVPALFFLAGTLAPSLRASESPIAIACLRLVTFLPLLPLFNCPLFFSCIALSTLSCAFFEYFAIVIDF
ncbi:MAG: hypothetical protein ACTHLE_06150 [Agriterribacter sp.]